MKNRINEPENRLVECIQSEEQRENNWKKWTESQGSVEQHQKFWHLCQWSSAE